MVIFNNIIIADINIAAPTFFFYHFTFNILVLLWIMNKI